MADSDYTVRGEGALTTVGFLVADIAHMDTAMTITGLKVTDPTATAIGRPAMIDDEIVRVDAVNGDIVTIARGCADTIPAAHEAGAPVWFFDMEMGTDRREYLAGETIAVKPLVHTPNSIPMTVASVPPRQLTFNQRFNRPYPPAEFKCKNDYWFTEVKELPAESTELVWTWNHRDRLLQADQLIDHNDGDVGPEAGTTYTARVYTNEDTLVRTVTGIVGKTWSYLRTDAVVDLPSGVGYVLVHSVRGGVESFYGYRTEVTLNIDVVVPTDPHFANVSLLLHMDGENESIVFTDSSPVPKTFSVVGAAKISTAQSKFGGASLYLNGSNSRILTAHTADAEFAGSDFTVECSYFFIDEKTTAGGYNILMAQDRFNESTARGWILLQDGSSAGKMAFACQCGSNYFVIVGAVKPSLNSWHHIAVVRQGSTLKLFEDGVLTATLAISGSLNTGTGRLSIGNADADAAGSPANSYVNGYIDELRITKGVARYTANFTPTIVPFPNA